MQPQNLPSRGTPAIDGESVYMLSSEGHLGAAGNILIVLTENGMLTIAEASPKSYGEISSAKVFEKTIGVKCWTSPVICGGKIYCRNLYGDLVCVDVRK